MPLISSKELLNKKLSSISKQYLLDLAKDLGIDKKGNVSTIVKRIIDAGPNISDLDDFIKKVFAAKIQDRKKIISDNDLKNELMKVQTFSWGVVQGQLDQKIQTEYVRKIVKYDDLVNGVKDSLHDEVTNYVICSWFNHWTTVLIEEHISQHTRVLPTIKNIKGIDIFFDGQPFDLKVTYLPRGYDFKKAINNPIDLAVWMYENQGAQRFGADNRLFVVLLDKKNPDKSWELKRDFDFVFREIDKFFDTESVTKNDEVVFSFHKKTYTTVTKVLIIVK